MCVRVCVSVCVCMCMYIDMPKEFLLQDSESSYSFDKVQRTVVCPIVLNS